MKLAYTLKHVRLHGVVLYFSKDIPKAMTVGLPKRGDHNKPS